MPGCTRPTAATPPVQAISPQIWGEADIGWEGSYWLDVRRISELEPIMKARIQMCKDKGFDSIEPDEITNWSNDSGFPITYQDQIDYNRAIASWAHEAGLSIGLKGDLEQAHDLVDDFDWTLNEECFQYDECTEIENSGGPGADGLNMRPGLQLFAREGKAVWIAEYKTTTPKWAASSAPNSQLNHFNTARYKLGLPNKGWPAALHRYLVVRLSPCLSSPRGAPAPAPSLPAPAWRRSRRRWRRRPAGIRARRAMPEPQPRHCLHRDLLGQ